MSNIFFSVILFILSIYTCNDKNNNTISSIDVNYTIPALLPDGSITNVNNNFSVYFLNNIALYEFNYSFSNDPTEELKFSKHYFVFENKDSVGHFFDPLVSRKTSNPILNVDSLLKKRALQGFNWSIILGFKPAQTYHRKDTVEDVYVDLNANSRNPDTLKFYYSNAYKNIDYSLSRVLDSAKNAKLFKLELHYNQKYDTSLNKILPARRATFEILENKNYNKEIILNFFKKYKETK